MALPVFWYRADQKFSCEDKEFIESALANNPGENLDVYDPEGVLLACIRVSGENYEFCEIVKTEKSKPVFNFKHPRR